MVSLTLLAKQSIQSRSNIIDEPAECLSLVPYCAGGIGRHRLNKSPRYLDSRKAARLSLSTGKRGLEFQISFPSERVAMCAVRSNLKTGPLATIASAWAVTR